MEDRDFINELEINPSTNLLERSQFEYSLQDVEEPNLYLSLIHISSLKSWFRQKPVVYTSALAPLWGLAELFCGPMGKSWQPNDSSGQCLARWKSCPFPLRLQRN